MNTVWKAMQSPALSESLCLHVSPPTSHAMYFYHTSITHNHIFSLSSPIVPPKLVTSVLCRKDTRADYLSTQSVIYYPFQTKEFPVPTSNNITHIVLQLPSPSQRHREKALPAKNFLSQDPHTYYSPNYANYLLT